VHRRVSPHRPHRPPFPASRGPLCLPICVKSCWGASEHRGAVWMLGVNNARVAARRAPPSAANFWPLDPFALCGRACQNVHNTQEHPVRRLAGAGGAGAGALERAAPRAPAHGQPTPTPWPNCMAAQALCQILCGNACGMAAGHRRTAVGAVWVARGRAPGGCAVKHHDMRVRLPPRPRQQSSLAS
jgi:hypothetical protein